MEKKHYEHKDHYCIFCKDKVNRIQQHFMRKHQKEDKVQIIINTQNKIERNWMWKKLRQEGDRLFNIKNEGENIGKRIIVKKPRVQHANQKYFTCENCHGRIRTTSKGIHLKRCRQFFNKEEEGEKIMLLDVYEGFPEPLINWIRSSICLDSFVKHKMDEKQNKQIIRTILTDLKKLEDTIVQESNEKTTLTSFFKPAHIDKLVNAICVICGEDIINGEKVIKYPFRAQRLLRLIHSVSKFLILYFSKRNLEWDILECTKFLNIFEAEAEKLMRKKINLSIRLKKFSKPVKLPQTSQINQLIGILKNETSPLIKDLNKNKTLLNWRKLAENILLRLTIFNRRRGGAVEKMKISEYLNTQQSLRTITEESKYNLNEEEKNFLENIKIVEILHKCKNIVPIYITKDLQEAMLCLHEHRQFAEIKDGNTYFFAASKGSDKPISCVKVMSKYRNRLPEEVRHLFTATNLRKHGATVAQILKFSKKDREEWAMHMGHSVDVHNKYYKKPEEVDGILKTARILNAMDAGILKFYKGRRISDLPLATPQPTPQSHNQLVERTEKNTKKTNGKKTTRKRASSCTPRRPALDRRLMEGSYSCPAGRTQKRQTWFHKGTFDDVSSSESSEDSQSSPYSKIEKACRILDFAEESETVPDGQDSDTIYGSAS